MAFTLRPDQEKLRQDAHALDGNRILVAPTGFGKTVVMGKLAQDFGNEPSVAIAHRHELVGQISTAIARFDIPHNIIGSDATVRYCISKHVEAHGRSFYNPRAPMTVASVDTIAARGGGLTQWANTVRHWMIDEAHHVLTDNKWGRAIEMFPRATGIGFTATPMRADRKSLARDQGGVFDHLVEGPSMRWLIEQGFLADYRAFCPKTSAIDWDAMKTGATGDFTGKSMRQEVHKAHITGDVVASWTRFAQGKRTICFAVDVEHANEIAKAFTEAGVRAAAVSAKTPAAVRDAMIRKFASGALEMLVNVDLFGEGFDVPAVECVIMARPTQSYGLYAQQFGRAIRSLPGKTHGIILDHVGNIMRHGLPDAPRAWTLRQDERGRRTKREEDEIKMKVCVECFEAYDACHKGCPHCGHVEEPAGRARPEQVDGDLTELDPSVLARLRGEIEKIDGECPIKPTSPRDGAMVKNWGARQEAQGKLRDAIALWAGVRRDEGYDDSMIYRRFFLRFGVDIATAQTLGRPEAEDLTARIENNY